MPMPMPMALEQQLQSVGLILVGLGRNPDALQDLTDAIKKRNPQLYWETVRGQLPDDFPMPDYITFTRTLQAVLTDPSKRNQKLIKIDQTLTFCAAGGQWAAAR
jgi:hypothetical protein